jgi:hypothetical protein
MASTRNKNMYSDWCFSLKQLAREQAYVTCPSPYVNNRPSFPVGVLNPAMPASVLSNNAVDIESRLYGIGANNFVNPPRKVNPQLITLPSVVFVQPAPVYIPKLPPPLVGQRPF